MATEQQRDALTRAEEILARIDVHRDLLIGGRWTPSADGGRLPVVDPSTGREVTDVAGAGERDVDAGVEAGRQAFDEGTWSRMAPAARARALNTFADAIEARTDDLYQLETLCNGRPIAETRAQLGRLPEWYRYNAALLMADRTDVIPMPGPYHTYTSRFPIGVVGILSSFNHPMMIGSKSLAPALATGNSVVLKPSELTPLTSLLLGQIALESGVPRRRPERGAGIGSIAGRAPGRAPGRGQDHVHGWHAGGQSGGPGRRRAVREGDGRARRQDAGARVRRRGHRDGRQGRRVRGLRRSGPDLHLRQSRPRPALDPRRVRRGAGRRSRARSGSATRSSRRRSSGRSISTGGARARARLRRARVEEGGTIAAGGAASTVPGLEGRVLRRAHRDHRPHQREPLRSRRDLRPDGGRRAVRGRGGRAYARRTIRTTGSARRSGPATSRGRTGWRRGSPTGSCG